ncbi:alpha/beta fold hydrolase [Streptomyces sp. NPDC057072]|uniref:alpha/beta fold hydrolase n=1 Tax=unclassified Streptomyces TaxID=2593676 RepID=UPI00364222DD
MEHSAPTGSPYWGSPSSQALVLVRPDLVRRLVLVGTKPRAGEMAGLGERVPEVAAHDVLTEEDYLYLFFGPSSASRDAGREFWLRRHERTVDVDPESGADSVRAQNALRADWNSPRGERFAELRRIGQPTLVVNGNNDIMVPTINSWILAQHIPQSQLIIYPDSGHGSLFQHPELCCAHVTRFLDSEIPFTSTTRPLWCRLGANRSMATVRCSGRATDNGSGALQGSDGSTPSPGRLLTARPQTRLSLFSGPWICGKSDRRTGRPCGVSIGRHSVITVLSWPS